MACIAYLKQHFPTSKKGVALSDLPSSVQHLKCCFRQELWYNEITANSGKKKVGGEMNYDVVLLFVRRPLAAVRCKCLIISNEF